MSMKLTNAEIEMLCRFAMAAYFTSPSIPSKLTSDATLKAIRTLEERELISGSPSRPTASGYYMITILATKNASLHVLLSNTRQLLRAKGQIA